MAESQTFYASYAPAMDVLKHKGKSLNIQYFFVFYWFCLDVQVGLNTIKMVREMPLVLSSVFSPGRAVQFSILILVCVKPISFGSSSTDLTPKENLSHG